MDGWRLPPSTYVPNLVSMAPIACKLWPIKALQLARAFGTCQNVPQARLCHDIVFLALGRVKRGPPGPDRTSRSGARMGNVKYVPGTCHVPPSGKILTSVFVRDGGESNGTTPVPIGRFVRALEAKRPKTWHVPTARAMGAPPPLTPKARAPLWCSLGHRV